MTILPSSDAVLLDGRPLHPAIRRQVLSMANIASSLRPATDTSLTLKNLHLLGNGITDPDRISIASTPLESVLTIVETESLRLLTHELPDPNLDLFYQHHFLTEFHLFSKLPIELRLRIWNLARARKVIAHFGRDMCLRSKTPTPVTFRVNRESRDETRQHYEEPYMLDIYPPIHTQRALHRHWFDPEVDTVFIKHRGYRNFLLDHRDIQNHSRSLPYGENLADIQSVEIHQRSWYISHYGNSKEGSWEAAYIKHKGGIKFRESIFSAFTGLKDLCIRGGEDGLLDYEDIQDCVSTLTQCYDELGAGGNRRGEVYSVPRIWIRMPCHKMGDDLEPCEECHERPNRYPNRKFLGGLLELLQSFTPSGMI